MVERLLLDADHVLGVRLADGRELEGDEVILSAGAIGSPAILLRSGHERPGIGANLQDHPSLRLVAVAAGAGAGRRGGGGTGHDHAALVVGGR